MGRLKKTSVAIFLGLVLIPLSVLGSGLRNIEDGWLFSTREMVSLLKPDSFAGSDSLMNTNDSGLWAVVGSMQLFGMPELPVTSLGLGAKLSRGKSSWVVGGLWQRTGRGVFQSDIQSLTFGWEKQWQANFNLERNSWTIANRSMPSRVGLMLMLKPPLKNNGKWTVGSEIRIPIWASSDWRNHEMRQGRFKVSLFRDNMVLVGSFEKKADFGWALGLEVAVALVSGVGITSRFDPDTGSLGPGTIWILRKLLLKTSHVIHPDLGLTHRVTLTTGSLQAVPW